MKLSQLPKHCLKFATQRRMVHIDDRSEEQLQAYLTFAGTPDGLRWLARHLMMMAESAEANGDASNIVAPWDFENQPIDLDGWDAIDFHCRDEQSS